MAGDPEHWTLLLGVGKLIFYANNMYTKVEIYKPNLIRIRDNKGSKRLYKDSRFLE
jgi:hypothetical protein